MTKEEFSEAALDAALDSVIAKMAIDSLREAVEAIVSKLSPGKYYPGDAVIHLFQSLGDGFQKLMSPK